MENARGGAGQSPFALRGEPKDALEAWPGCRRIGFHLLSYLVLRVMALGRWFGRRLILAIVGPVAGGLLCWPGPSNSHQHAPLKMFLPLFGFLLVLCGVGLRATPIGNSAGLNARQARDRARLR